MAIDCSNCLGGKDIPDWVLPTELEALAISFRSHLTFLPEAEKQFVKTQTKFVTRTDKPPAEVRHVIAVERQPARQTRRRTPTHSTAMVFVCHGPRG